MKFDVLLLSYVVKSKNDFQFIVLFRIFSERSVYHQLAYNDLQGTLPTRFVHLLLGCSYIKNDFKLFILKIYL